MITIAIKTNTEIIYRQMYEWFADFVWDLFDETKGKGRTLNIPYNELLVTGEKTLQFLLKNILQLIEFCILLYMQLAVKRKKVHWKEICETVKASATDFIREIKQIVQSIKNSCQKTYNPGFDSYMIINSC